MSKIIKILILAVIFKQILWSSFIPMWQFPDEQAHFAQVQNQAEGNPINPARSNNTSKEIDESEILLGTKRDEFGNNKFTYHPEFKLDYSNKTSGIYEDEIRRFTLKYRHEFVSNEATAYPPLYYQLAALFYNTFNHSDLFTRLYFTRLFNIVLFLILLFLILLIAKLLFPFNQVLQITLILLVTFHPMLSFVAGGVNSDNLFNLLFTLGIYLNLLLLKEGWNIKIIIFTLITFYFINNTKPQGQLLVLLYIFPVLLSIIKKRSLILFSFSILFVFLILKNNILNFTKNQQFLPEIPQFSSLTFLSLNSYLTHMNSTLSRIYRETMPWYWGVFRWLSLTYPRLIHRIINWTLVASLVGIIFNIRNIIIQKKKSKSFIYFLFLVYSTVIYILALISYDYLFTFSHGFSLGLQGRYFFPVIVAQMSILLIGLNSLNTLFNMKQNFIKLAGLGMVLLHTYAFIFVNKSYFESSPIKLFFLQASQYKPVIFKSPSLEIFMLIQLISLCIFIWYYLRMEQNNAAI